MAGSAIMPLESWGPRRIETRWDDLLAGVATAADWAVRREELRRKFLGLLRDEAKPAWDGDLKFRVDQEWRDAEGFTIQTVSYQVAGDERARGYLAVPAGAAPSGGWAGVLCLQGTINWGARRTLDLPPEAGDPDAAKGRPKGDFARVLVRAGFVTLSPEHFCCGARMPAEGPFHTSAFYRKHPGWTAIGKSTYESRIGLDVLGSQGFVDGERLGVTGHSLGGHNSIFIGAYDERVKCVAASCAGPTIRENAEPLEWSRDRWYVYIPQIRERLLKGEDAGCDFHEMMALVSPRPLLDMFALNDGDGATQAQRVMLHLKLREVYRMAGAEAGHGFVVGGDGHGWTDLTHAAMREWMQRWLVRGG